MTTTEYMSAPAYADLVRDVVDWIQSERRVGGVVTYRSIARVFRLTHAEIDDVIRDSGAYGPKLVRRTGPRSKFVGSTIVEVAR